MQIDFYRAEISNIEKRVVVAIALPSGVHAFTRSFYAICDAERWLVRLARVGLRTRDYAYLLEKDVSAVDLPPVGPIAIVDKRLARRSQLPEFIQ